MYVCASFIYMCVENGLTHTIRLQWMRSTLDEIRYS